MKLRSIKIFGIVIIFITLGLDLIAQEISYYDKDWIPTTKDKAVYYFVTIDNYPRYMLNTLVKYDKNLEKHEKKFSKKIRKEIGGLGINEINFRESDYDSIYLGRLVKVFYPAIYDYLCKSTNDSIDWPSEEIRRNSGVCYKNWQELLAGSRGKIVWKFKHFKSSGDETVFLIKFDKFYVPINGSALTMCDKYSGASIPKTKEKFFYRIFHKKLKPINQI
jgi:hypothetical protein